MAPLDTAAILITDLVGSTGLAARVGPVRADELRRDHFGILREAVARSDGREVKNIGDGLMVAFGSASDAVRCAVLMQQLMERRNRAHEEQLYLRIGLSAGECTVEDGDFFGLVPVEAARLCNLAPGGGILATIVVKLLAQQRAGDFESIGELELKGLPEPVPTFAVAWEPLALEPAGGVPLPALLRSSPAATYVGRVRERAQLEACWRAARTGQRHAALLSGEPGIGKTRLAAHVALEAHRVGFVVCWGAAAEDVGAPYGAWMQALGHYVEHAPADVLAEHVRRHGGELTRLVPVLARRVEGTPAPRETDADTERFLLHGAVVGLLEAAAAAAPLVLVLDDLQWADSETITLFKHVLAAGDHVGLLAIATYRDSDIDRDHPLTSMLADLRRLEHVTRVALEGLELADVVAFMASAVGRDLGAAGLQLAREVTHETDGNPFFLAEILRHLTESGAIVQDELGRWQLRAPIADLGLPQSVHEVIGRRVARLGPEVNAVLDVASVIGRSFDIELLQRLVDADESDLLDALDAAVSSSVLAESSERAGRFSFAHALIDHTLYRALSVTRRAWHHRRVAEAMEALYGEGSDEHLPDLAYHWSQAGVAEVPERAIEYARRAGEQALAKLAPDEAARWFSRALEMQERLSSGATASADAAAAAADVAQLRHAELLSSLGGALVRAGDPTARDVLRDAAEATRRAHAPAVLAQVALSFGAYVLSAGYDEELGLLLEEALGVTGESDGVMRVRLLTRLALALHYAPQERRREQLVSEAVAVARRLGDPEALSYALGHGHLATRSAVSSERSLAWIDEALALSPPDRQLVLALHAGRVDILLELDRIADARVQLDVLQRAIDEVPEPRALPWGPLHRARMAMIEGRLDDALALNAQAAEMGARLAGTTIPVLVLSQRHALQRLTGAPGDPPVITRPMLEAVRGIPSLRVGLALQYRDAGDVEQARLEYDSLAADDFANVSLDSLWLVTMAVLSELCAYLGDERRAAILYEALLPFAGRNAVAPVATYWGPVTRYLAMLAVTRRQWDTASEHHAAAWASATKARALPVQVQLLYEQAQMLAARAEHGDRERALELLGEARSIAPASMAVVLARVEDLQQRLLAAANH